MASPEIRSYSEALPDYLVDAARLPPWDAAATINERTDKAIQVLVDGSIVTIDHTKFGAAVGPASRIGANAVTTPGTVLPAGSVVGRLELVDQISRHLGR